MTIDSPKIFSELIKKRSYHGKSVAPLFQITFFLGAGFSKAWDENYPLGTDLFQFSMEELQEEAPSIGKLLLTLGYFDSDVTVELFKDIVYQLEMFGKYPEIRPRYIDEGNILLLRNQLTSLVKKKFDLKVNQCFFNKQMQKIEIPYKINSDQNNIIRFFQILREFGTGDTGNIAEGIRPNFITTNYDNLVEAIWENGLGSDDSFSLYFYRGITPKWISDFSNLEIVHDHWLAYNLFKINGGFEVFRENEIYHFNYNKKSAKDFESHPPIIMLPSREQNYTDPYFQAVFPKSIRLLRETHALVIVGYSFPEEDALIRLLIKQFRETATDAIGKVVFFVDKMEVDKKVQRLSSIFPGIDGDRFLKIIPFEGSFSKWVESVNSNFPSH